MGWLSTVANIAGPVVGFATGGPVGAAAGSAIANLATGGSPTDAAKGAALSFLGGNIAQAGGLAGGRGLDSLNVGSFAPSAAWNTISSNPLALLGMGGDYSALGGLATATSEFGGSLANPGAAGAALGGGGAGGSGFGPISTLLGGASSLSALYQAEQLRQLARQAMQIQDPFGSQRGQYQQQLAALMSNPSSITGLPGYQAGLDAVIRGGAAQGYIGSGNMLTALQKYGGQFYNDEVSRLAGLAGANIGPTYAGQVGLAGLEASNAATTNALARFGLMFPKGA